MAQSEGLPRLPTSAESGKIGSMFQKASKMLACKSINLNFDQEQTAIIGFVGTPKPI
jgi:hypothetical protein